MNIFPRTVSARKIQRDYRKVFDTAKKTRDPVIVLTNNVPDVAIVSLPELERLYARANYGELTEAMAAIETYKKEKKDGKLKKLSNIKDLE